MYEQKNDEQSSEKVYGQLIFNLHTMTTSKQGKRRQISQFVKVSAWYILFLASVTQLMLVGTNILQLQY